MDTGTRTKAIDPSNYELPVDRDRSVGGPADRDPSGDRSRGRTLSGRRAGIQVSTSTSSPSVLDFGHAGQTRTFRVTFTPTTTSYDKAATGFLTWKGKRGAVRMPLAVTPRALEAPAQVAGTGSSGQVSVPRDLLVQPGPFTAVAGVLATGSPRTGS